MKLSEVPWEQLKIGMKVKSPHTGQTGVVTALIKAGETKSIPFNDGSGIPPQDPNTGAYSCVHGAREDDVLIDWENGNQSLTFHFWCDGEVLP